MQSDKCNLPVFFFFFVADVNHILAINKDHIVVASGSTLEVCLVTAGPDTHGGATYQLERVKKLVPIHKENVTCMILVGGKKYFPLLYLFIYFFWK